MNGVAELVDQSVEGERPAGHGMRPRRFRARLARVPMDSFAPVHSRAEKSAKRFSGLSLGAGSAGICLGHDVHKCCLHRGLGPRGQRSRVPESLFIPFFFIWSLGEVKE